MNIVLNYVKDFIEKEFEAILAKYLERDNNIFESKVSAVQSFYSDGLDAKISRPDEPDEDFWAEAKEVIDRGDKLPRTLFQIKEYSQQKYKQLYRVYLSSQNTYKFKKPSYGTNFYIAPEGESFKIISQYDFDIWPDKRGTRMKEGGLTWLWRGGEKLNSIGKYVGSMKFEAPDKPEHLVEYDAQ